MRKFKNPFQFVRKFQRPGVSLFHEPNTVYVFRPNTASSWDDRRVDIDKEQLLGMTCRLLLLRWLHFLRICFFKDNALNRRDMGSRSALSDLPPQRILKWQSGIPDTHSFRPTSDIRWRAEKSTLWSFRELWRQDGTYVPLASLMAFWQPVDGELESEL